MRSAVRPPGAGTRERPQPRDSDIPPPRILVIARADDPLAQALVSLCRQREVAVEHLDHERGVRRLSVRVGPEVATVRPRVPIYLGPFGGDEIPEDADSRFQHGERVATLWAAAALAGAPVVGRPGPYGFGGRVSRSGVVTELNGRFHAGRPERFQSWIGTAAPDPRMSGSTDGTWCWEDERTRRVDEAGAFGAGDGPFRGRPLLEDEGYELVTVVGDRAFRSSSVELPLDRVEQRSIEHAGSLECDFASVVWAVSASRARIARVDPWPSWWQVQYAWPDVGHALVEYLLR